MDNDDDRLAAECARLEREKGWPAGERERLEDLLSDEERRRALFDHPRRMQFVGRAGGDAGRARRFGRDGDLRLR